MFNKAPKNKAKVFSFVPTGEYYFNKGIQAYERHDLMKSKKYLNRAMQLEPLEPVIACQLALVYTEIGEYNESNALLMNILENLDKNMTECHYFIANNYAHLGLFMEAYKHAHMYLEQDRVGEFAEDAEELMEVIGFEEGESLEQLEEQDEIITLQEKAKSLLESGDFTSAIELLEQTTISHPEFWPAYNNLALAYFYQGDAGKAEGVLEKVLDRNPGNLHALCNMAVFLHYERKTEELDKLLTGLEKVRPLIFEHRYKLGATFALAERYELAFSLLRKLQRYGFEGDAGFYYWLSKSAFYTGNREIAKQAWEQVAQLGSEKAVKAPWEPARNPDDIESFEFILTELNSSRMEDRLLAIFLISISKEKQKVLGHPDFKPIDEFTVTEKVYLANILQTGNSERLDPEGLINKAHQTALSLYEHNRPMTGEQADLLRSWFSAFLSGMKSGEEFSNPEALAAAVHYKWHNRTSKLTQTAAAEMYGISTATLRKYIRIIGPYWQ